MKFVFKKYLTGRIMKYGIDLLTIRRATCVQQLSAAVKKVFARQTSPAIVRLPTAMEDNFIVIIVNCQIKHMHYLYQ